MALEVLKAAEIWYPVVWQEIKDPSNVIDYNINQEQTKDASSITNANNQTTTWLATVVPWINAPKLKAETSIIWWWASKTTLSTASCSMSSMMQANEYTRFDTITLSWTWNMYEDDGDLYIASGWLYFITVSWNSNNANSTDNALFLRKNHNGSFSYICNLSWLTKADTRSCAAELDAWDYIKIYFESNHSCNPTASVSFIKLW